MALVLNDEQRLLQATAEAFFAETLPVQALRTLRDRQDATGFDPAAWREMAELGWAGILIPEELGGTAFGYQGIGLVLEAAGRTLAASPLVSTALVSAPLIGALGNAVQRASLLPGIASGERVVTLALEETLHHAPTTIATSATHAADGWHLAGTKRFVPDGHVADCLLVLARSAGQGTEAAGLTLFAIPADAPGVTRTRLHLVDGRNAARITLDDVLVGDDARLGPVDGAWPALERILDGARAGLAAEMLGNAQEAFDRTLRYLKLREQFGVPIGSFQALKHRAADLFCELELTRSAVRGALEALDQETGEASALASLAKAKACDTLERVTSEALQMHGGIGMTDAEDIGLFLKRARVAQWMFGDARFHRDRYARLLGF